MSRPDQTVAERIYTKADAEALCEIAVAAARKAWRMPADGTAFVNLPPEPRPDTVAETPTPREARDAEVGAAIERAAALLPDGFSVEISVERGAGSVTLRDDDGYEYAMDVDSDNRLAAEIHAAIAAAIERARKG